MLPFEDSSKGLIIKLIDYLIYLLLGDEFMGFLDLLSSKKKNDSNSSVPPPAPGPGKVGLPSHDISSENKQEITPPNNSEDFNKETTTTSGDFNQSKEQHNNNLPEPPVPSPNQVETPKFDEMSIGTKETTQGPSAQSNSRIQDDFDFPKLDLPKFPGSEIKESEEPIKEQPKDETVHNQNEDVEEQSVPSFDNNLTENQEKRRVSSYLSADELRLNSLRDKLHKPQRNETSDSSSIGNVESTLKHKIRNVKGPLFIGINDYKRVLNSLDEMKRDLNESQEFVLKLDEFNDRKYNEFEKWKKTVEYINSKLIFVDKTLFKE